MHSGGHCHFHKCIECYSAQAATVAAMLPNTALLCLNCSCYAVTDIGRHDAQVRKDFREAMKRMLPRSEYVAALSQHTKFTNKEGIFGDPEIMSLTRDDSEHAIPTYQFWMEHGKLMPVLHSLLHHKVTGILFAMSHCATYALKPCC